MEENKRLSWEEYFKKIVLVTAERSNCHRLNVGCILVKDNRIISQGYNGFLPGCPHESIVKNGHEQATVHAEQNAIADCAKRGAACGASRAQSHGCGVGGFRYAPRRQSCADDSN